MVHHHEAANHAASRHSSPRGASPASASVEAPSSRPQTRETTDADPAACLARFRPAFTGSSWPNRALTGSSVDPVCRTCWGVVIAALSFALVHSTAARAQAVAPSPGAGPVIVVDTAKGAFELETYPAEAPMTVAHFVELVNKGFYDGLRFHRVVPGFVIQAGDPQTRDMTTRERWGRGSAASSGHPVGVAEYSKKRVHRQGAVAMAHAGDAARADSQFYVTLAARPELNGKYTVFGQVINGLDVAATIQVGDVIRKMSVRATGSPSVRTP